MKKMRKIFAVLLTLAMVLGMSMTSFAADETVTITLTGLEDASTVQILQIIAPDTSTTSGWAFVNGAGAKYAEAYGVEDTAANEQAIIWGLIKYQNSSVKLPTGVTTISADATKIATALQKVESLTGFVNTDSKTATAVSVAGVYAIKATGENYTYKTMSAYVGFGDVENNKYPSLTGTEVTAKKSPATVVKTTKDTDNAVAIGDIVTYEIETYVPVIDPTKTLNRTFTVTDRITGADYYLSGTGAIKKVTVDGENKTTDFDIVPNGNTFTVNFDSLVASLSNDNAGKKIVITYTAKVTAVTVENTAIGHFTDKNMSGNTVNLYTGSIELTKVDANKTSKGLAGATFNVFKDGASTPLKFTKESNGVYKYDPKNSLADIVTADGGKLVVKGLDKGSYHFKETFAPEGYSINTDGLTVNLTYDGNKATANFESKGNSNVVKDSTLSALPATGGIGTTIFTIAGCVIMIAAAGLFFASRKKSDNK